MSNLPASPISHTVEVHQDVRRMANKLIAGSINRTSAIAGAAQNGETKDINWPFGKIQAEQAFYLLKKCLCDLNVHR